MRIVLVGTTHPGNIGAAARAMKTMGLSELTLVEPAVFPAAEATARAAGADDILARATVTATLAEALDGCAVVYGTTARARRIGWPTLSPREAAAQISASTDKVAMVFGRERSGLSNAELDLCQHAVVIATNPDYRSLNLAQAVQICAYEIRVAQAGAAAADEAKRAALDPPATAEALTRAREHCMRVMAGVDYLDPARPKLLDRRMRRFFSRSGMRHSEVQVLRGFLSAIERRLGNK